MGRLKSAGRRLAEWIRIPSGLAGGCLGATVVAAQPGGTGLPGFVIGWLYGVVVGGALRLFRVPPGVYPLAGLLAGPLPIALLMPAGAGADARGLVWLGALAGLVIGLVEWGASRARGAAAPRLGDGG
ncbi:MAG TPA: hypothetical protein VF530_05965 [Planctomycetota bacterium]